MITPTAGSSRARVKAAASSITVSWEAVGELDQGTAPKSVAPLGAVDGDLRDPGVVAGGQLVADVGVVALGLPGGAHVCSCSGSLRAGDSSCRWRYGAVSSVRKSARPSGQNRGICRGSWEILIQE